MTIQFKKDNKRVMSILLTNREGKKMDALEVDLVKIATTTVDLNKVFSEINEYFKTLPQRVCEKIFGLYDEILEMELDELPQMRMKCIEIYECIYLDDIIEVANKLDLPHPAVKDEYNYTDTIDNGISYIKSDYQDLVHYILWLRPLIPVFAHIAILHPRSGQTKEKEEIALSVINGTEILHHPAYARLERYMGVFCENIDSKITFAQITEGQSSEDMLSKFIALNIVRRLAFFKFGKDANGEANNVISNIYNYTTNKAENLCSPVSGVGVFRRKEMKSASEDGRIRGIDSNYSATQKTPDGDRILASLDISDKRLKVLHRIEPNLDLQKVIDLFKFNVDNGAFVKEPLFVQYVLNDLVKARMIVDITNVKYQRLWLFTAAQAILAHWELYDLALMVTGHRKTLPVSIYYNNSKKLLTDDRREFLKDNWPSIKEENVAIKAVDLIASSCSHMSWELVAPKWLLDKGTMTKQDYGYLTAKTIRNQVADLFIKLHGLEVGDYK